MTSKENAKRIMNHFMTIYQNDNLDIFDKIQFAKKSSLFMIDEMLGMHLKIFNGTVVGQNPNEIETSKTIMETKKEIEKI